MTQASKRIQDLPIAPSLAAGDYVLVSKDGVTVRADVNTLLSGGAFAPMSHVGSGGAEHTVAVAGGSAGFMSGSDKSKLDGVAAGANNYSHPATHPPSIITQDASNRFVTDAEKAAWNAKQPAGNYATGGGTATGTNTGDETTATIKSKLGITTLSGSNTGDQTSVTGNAGTATALQTARTINGVSFDGTANITINAVDSTPRVATSLLGAANGVATLDSGGKVPSAQLPAYVDDVLEYANLAAFPATGTAGIIYVALDTNKTYRWGGSAYTYITSGAVDSVAGKTGVVNLVKGDVGLGNVDNTADSTKSVSYAATAGNAATATKLQTARTIAGVSFDGSANISIAYSGLTGLPTLGTSAAKDIPATGDASATQVVYGTDTRLTNSRNAADVYAWAKAATKPTYTAAEVGAQPLDADLTAIAALAGTSGLLKKTAADTWTLDTTAYTTNLGTVTSVTGTAPVISSGGTTPVISMAAATSTVNGYMTSTYAAKLDGIAAGAQVNVATNLAQGTRTTTTVPITSSTGTSATLDVATTSLAGVMSSADKAKLDGIAPGATAGDAPLVITTDTTATVGVSYVINAALTLTLPASPATGSAVSISNVSGVSATVARNGQLLMGLSEDMTVDAGTVSAKLVFIGGSTGWSVVEISATEVQSLPIATAAVLGGVKVGSGLTVDAAGLLAVSDSRTASIKAQYNITGGGTIAVDASSYVSWSERYIAISNGNGSHFSTNGYFDIYMPTSGTITGVGGAANVTATAAGIPLNGWQALYYILPVGSNSTSVATNFRVASHGSALVVPDTWVLICIRNGDNGRFYFPNGYSLQLSQSVNTGTYSTRYAYDSDLLDGLNSTSFLRSNTGTGFSGGVLQVTATAGALGSSTTQVNTLQIYQATLNSDAFQTFHVVGDYAVHFGLDGTTNDLFVGGWSMGAVKNRIWHAGNDGSGSGLDADLLDGQHGSYYAPIASPQFTGTPKLSTGFCVGTDNDVYLYEGAPNVLNIRTGASGSYKYFTFWDTGDFSGGRYLYASYFNMSGAVDATAATEYYFGYGDGFIRRKTLANVKAEIVTSAAVVAGLGYTPANPGGLTVSVISTNTTATAGTTYCLTASLTLTLPATPAAGAQVTILNRSGVTTCIVARNGSNIMELAQDITLDLSASFSLVYTNATNGWVIL